MTKRLMKPVSLVAVGLVSLVFLGGIVYAANSYRVGKSGASLAVTEHGTCKVIKNNNGSDIFVPTKTSNEWGLFRTNAKNVALSNCGPVLLRTDVYYNNGSNPTYTSTAPAGTTYVVIKAWGGGGGGKVITNSLPQMKYCVSNPDYGRGGHGAFVESTVLSWSSGKTLSVVPGGGGSATVSVDGVSGGLGGAGGGGYTRVSGTFGQVIAAGGGGQGGPGGSNFFCPGGDGGDGGNTTGSAGGKHVSNKYLGSVGGGGTQSAGGAAATGGGNSSANPAVAGASLKGGLAGDNHSSIAPTAGGFNGGGGGGFGYTGAGASTGGGGGGGAGYFGGGGGGIEYWVSGSGGGGGSSFATASGLSTSMYSGDPTNSDSGYSTYSTGGNKLSALRVARGGSDASGIGPGGPGAAVIEYWQE